MGRKKNDYDIDLAFLHKISEEDYEPNSEAYSDLQYLLQSQDYAHSAQQTAHFDIVDKYGQPAHDGNKIESLHVDAGEVRFPGDNVDLDSEGDLDFDTSLNQPVHPQPGSIEPNPPSKTSGEVDNEKDNGNAHDKRSEKRKTRFFQNPNIVGIDYGKNSIKFIVLRKSATGYKIEDYGCQCLDSIHDTKPDHTLKEEEKQQKARAAFAGKIRKNDLIISSISGLEVIYRMLSVPRMTRKELANAIPWALRKDLPFGIDTARVDFRVVGHVVDGDRETSNIATLATPKEIVEQHLELYDGTGFMPAKITSTAIALWNVILQQKAYLARRLLVIEVGASACHLIFVNKGNLDFHREITTAGNDFIEAIAETDFISEGSTSPGNQDPYEILRNYVVPKEKANEQPENGKKLNTIDANILQVLDRLVREIIRSIDYYKETFHFADVETVLLCGGGALIKGLDAYLSRSLELPVEILNPLQCSALRKAARGRELEEIAPRMAVALGLALGKSSGLNLLPKKIQKAHKSQKAIKFISYIIFTLLVCMALATGYSTLLHTKRSEDLRLLETKFRLLTPQREQYIALSRRLEELHIKQQAYSKQVYAITSPEAHLRAISNLVPKSIALVSLKIALPQAEKEEEQLQVQEQESEHERGQEQTQGYEEITLRGIVFPDRALEGVNLSSFLLKLQTSGYFQDVEISGKEIQADGTVGFVVKCYY